MSEIEQIRSDLMDMQKSINETLRSFEENHIGIIIDKIELYRMEWNYADASKYSLPSVEIDLKIK